MVLIILFSISVGRTKVATMPLHWRLASLIFFQSTAGTRGNSMAWTTPTLVEICIGLEINGYLPAEF